MQTEIAAGRPFVTHVSESRHEPSPVRGAGFDAVYRAEYSAVIRHLTYLTGDRALAEDLAQEAFGRYLTHSDSGQPIRNPHGWLLTVASNLAYNHFRTEGRRAEREARLARPVQVSDEATVSIDVREALDRLEPRDRTMILLRHAGFTYAEIAEVLGVAVSSVGTTLARAQRRFRELYEPSQTSIEE